MPHLRTRPILTSFLSTLPVALLALAMLTATLGGARAADMDNNWIAESDRHARQVMEALAELAPESASSAGLSEFDAGIFYLGADHRERANALESRLIRELTASQAEASDPRVRQDLAIMIEALTDSIESRNLYRRLMLPYHNLHQTLFYNFRAILDPRLDAGRHPAALKRLAKYAGLVEGYSPLTELARRDTQAAFSRPGLHGPYRGELETDLADAPRYIAGMRGLFESSGLSGWEDDFAVLEQQLDAYVAWLRSDLLPRSRDSNLLPPEIYADRLRDVGVRETPERLIADGTYAFQAIASEMRALAVRIAEQRQWPDNDLVTVLRRLKSEQIAADQVLPTYRARLAALETIIRDNDIVSLPERDASIRLATEAESAAVPASFMNPPQLINNTGQYGEFVLVQKNPALGPDAQMDDWSHDAITWALTAHEARPGHELQFTRLVEDGVSIARARYAFNSANAEGWGLYAESLVHPYLPLEAQLFSLYSRWMRAARMFLDPMVNTGKLTRDEAAAFLEDQVALSPAMAASEADRYAFRMPGQATAYYYGYQRMLSLRTELELRLGADFDQRAFHDVVLEQGLLPPELLRAAVLEHFLP
jgi:hypothetical protein